MDPFIGSEKKEEQQSWYQSGLKPLDLWGFSAIVGGQFESSIYQLRPNQNQAFSGRVLSHAKSYIRVQSTWLVKAWLIKKSASCICLQISAAMSGCRRRTRSCTRSRRRQVPAWDLKPVLFKRDQNIHTEAPPVRWLIRWREKRGLCNTVNGSNTSLSRGWGLGPLTIWSRISCWPVATSVNPEHTHEYIYF